jgi:hypothetical protein
MLGGAASFTPGFFSDLAKAAGTSGKTKRDPQTPSLSSSDSLNSMLSGASNFGPKFLAGDAKGVADALNGMIWGATSFTPGFFSDLAKAAGTSSKIKRDPQAPQLSSSDSLNWMLSGATNFAPKFLAGDAKGVADALNGMLSGAASFTPGFFSDLAKAAGNATAASRPPWSK